MLTFRTKRYNPIHREEASIYLLTKGIKKHAEVFMDEENLGKTRKFGLTK